MSLLTDASLILTPNAYNVGKLYSVIPNTTLGDMDVSRGSSATRVNSAGLIEIARTNLVLQSQTLENPSWSKTIGGTGIAPVVTANAGTAPDGTMTADRVVFDCNGTLSADRSILLQTLVTTIGTRYYQSIYVKAFSSGQVGNQLRIASDGLTGLSSIITLTADWQRIVLNGLASSATTFFIVETRGGVVGTTNPTADVLLWGAQMEAGETATEYIPTIASIRTKFAGITQDGGFALNIPRIDYPPLGGCPSILVEPARTNLVLYSEEFDNASWSKSGTTISPNTTTSPSNTTTADKIVEVTAASLPRVSPIGTVVTLVPHTITTFAKAAERTQIRIVADSSAAKSAYYDLINGTVVNVGASATASITLYNNGWYRCILTYTPSVIGNGFYIATAEAGNTIASGDNTKGVFLWGAQIEAGSYATSYIPTTTAAVPRDAELISRNNIYTNGLLSASGGTWFVELNKNLALTRDGLMTGLFLDTSTDSFTNGFNIRNTGGNSRLTITKWQGGGGGVLYTTTTDTTKIAIKWNGTTADIFANGVKVVIATSFTPTAMQFLKVDSSIGIPYNINQMALFPTPLSDDQCILLTGPSFSSYPEMASALIYTLQ